METRLSWHTIAKTKALANKIVRAFRYHCLLAKVEQFEIRDGFNGYSKRYCVFVINPDMDNETFFQKCGRILKKVTDNESK